MISEKSEKIERKLEYFANTMMQEVEAKKSLAKLESTTTLTKSTAAAFEAATRHNRVMLQAKQGELQRNANRQIAQAKVQEMTQYVKTRKQQIDRLFIEIAAQLAAFTQKAEYEDYLLERIKEAQSGHDFSIIKLSPHDMRLDTKIKSATGLTPEAGDQDFIGGFILLNELRTIQADYSFKARLSAAKKAFAHDQHHSDGGF